MSAHADTVSFKDARGDAPARYDLTKVVLGNGEDAVVVRVRLRDLSPKGTQVFGVSLAPVEDSVTFMAYSVRKPDGSIRNRLFASTADTHSKVKCAMRTRWRPRAEVIKMAIPHDCLVDGTMRSNVFIGPGDGTAGDPVDWTKMVGVAQD